MRTAEKPYENESTEDTTMSGTRASRRGFGGYNSTVDDLNRTTFQVKDNSLVIAFLEPENFTFALRHWIKYQDPEDPKGQITRAEWCLEEDCPLCEIGDRPKAVAFFNVVKLDNPGKVLVWEASADPTDAIQKEFNKLQKLSPARNLNDPNLYWVVSKEKGKNGFYSYSVDKLTESSLLEEWKSLRPLTGAQRTTLGTKLYTEDYVEYKTRAELQEFVDSITE